MTASDTPDAGMNSFTPEDLDGHTIDELSDYLDAGRRPWNASIEQSEGCRLALDALERIQCLTPALLDANAAAQQPPDEGWVRSILDAVVLDARAGKRIPFASEASGSDLAITEGAVRALIRQAEAGVSGVVVGRCRFNGDVADIDASIVVQLEISVLYGNSIPESVAQLREEVLERLRTHTDMRVTAVDITVHDVRPAPSEVAR